MRARGHWPRALVERPSEPRDVAPPWAEHVQGLTYAEPWWFVTQVERLWRLPRRLVLAGLDGEDTDVTAVEPLTEGLDHLGDLDAADGVLYVAMEGTDPARIGVFDLELNLVGSAPVAPQGDSCPWCARNPVDGLVYSSRFDTDRLERYRPRLDRDRAGGVTGVHLQSCGSVELRDGKGRALALERVQGGAFSPRGQLYITSDTRRGGLMGIDVVTGQRRLHVPIEYEPDPPKNEVVEGVAVVDLDDGRIPGMSGQVHVLCFSGAAGRHDRVWLRHFGAPDGAMGFSP